LKGSAKIEQNGKVKCFFKLMFAPDFSKKFTWTGKSNHFGEGKNSFSGFDGIFLLLVESINRSSSKSISAKDLKSAVQ
jgi:hypothetical protein